MCIKSLIWTEWASRDAVIKKKHPKKLASRLIDQIKQPLRLYIYLPLHE